jgi:hypothetical protein
MRRRLQCAVNGNPPFLRYHLSFYAKVRWLILAPCQAGFTARAGAWLGEVHAAIRRAGGNPYRLTGQSISGKRSGRFNARGRGASAALSLKGRNGWSRDASGIRSRTRRVAVKARVVKLNPQRGGSRGRQFVSAKAVGAHLRYLERDGVTRDGERGQVYCVDRDVADGSAFLDRGREDRHQFRFIVSAEEGGRKVLARMSPHSKRLKRFRYRLEMRVAYIILIETVLTYGLMFRIYHSLVANQCRWKR